MARLSVTVALGGVFCAGAAGAGCATLPPMAPGTPQRPHIQQLELGIANAYVVYGARPILVDTGTAGEGDGLAEKLGELGIKPGALALIVLTHGHGDHGGSAERIHKEWRAPIAVGAGDVAMLHDGHNRTLRPSSMTARMLRPFVDRSFPPYAPEIIVTGPIDLRPYGLAGRIIPTPGHTPGSQVVLLDDGDALVGDLLLGGYLGGAIAPGQPGTHYFHDDRLQAETQICFVIRQGARRLFVGHGGPIAAEAAWEKFCSAGDPMPAPSR
jgi:glyoxylase-like metal-dependent hydrolase (beta-lactamase superfamily II)